MGGAMALHLALRYHQDVAGVFALSSFLNKGSVVYQVNAFQRQDTLRRVLSLYSVLKRHVTFQRQAVTV